MFNNKRSFFGSSSIDDFGNNAFPNLTSRMNGNAIFGGSNLKDDRGQPGFDNFSFSKSRINESASPFGSSSLRGDRGPLGFDNFSDNFSSLKNRMNKNSGFSDFSDFTSGIEDFGTKSSSTSRVEVKSHRSSYSTNTHTSPSNAETYTEVWRERVTTPRSQPRSPPPKYEEVNSFKRTSMDTDRNRSTSTKARRPETPPRDDSIRVFPVDVMDSELKFFSGTNPKSRRSETPPPPPPPPRHDDSIRVFPVDVKEPDNIKAVTEPEPQQQSPQSPTVQSPQSPSATVVITSTSSKSRDGNLLPGVYVIENVACDNAASLNQDDDYNATIKADTDRDEGMHHAYWIVSRCRNGRYDIRHYWKRLYAFKEEDSSQSECDLRAHTDRWPNQWVISLEENQTDIYSIHDSNKNWYWGLEKCDLGAPVRLFKGPKSRHTCWRFVEVRLEDRLILTGCYTIQNVKHKNFAILADSNDGSCVTAGYDGNDLNAKWNVTRLGNDRYKIESYSSGNYANLANRPGGGTTIEGRSTPTQFVIQTTEVPGQFTIATTDERLFWSFPVGEDLTPCDLNANGTDQRNWWIFNPTR